MGYGNSKSAGVEFEGKINALLYYLINARLIIESDWNCRNDPIKDCHPQRSLRGTS